MIDRMPPFAIGAGRPYKDLPRCRILRPDCNVAISSNPRLYNPNWLGIYFSLEIGLSSKMRI